MGLDNEGTLADLKAHRKVPPLHPVGQETDSMKRVESVAASWKLYVLQPLGEAFARGSIVTLTRIVDDVQGGTFLRELFNIPMPHELQQLRGIDQRCGNNNVEGGELRDLS